MEHKVFNSWWARGSVWKLETKIFIYKDIIPNVYISSCDGSEKTSFELDESKLMELSHQHSPNRVKRSGEVLKIQFPYCHHK